MAALALGLGGVGLLVLAFAHTNGFRYGPSLEAVSVLGPVLLLASGVVLPMAVLGIRRGSRGLAGGALIGVFVLAAVAGILGWRAFGSAFPLPRAHDTRVTDFVALQTAAGRVEYAIELRDPFARSHREYVVLRYGEQEHRIELRLFGAKATGLVWTGNPAEFLDVAVEPGGTRLTLTPKDTRGVGSENAGRPTQIDVAGLKDRQPKE
jgi:hypothetical protein